jgi:hypothetical protein
MSIQSDTKQLYFQGLGPRKVVADFDGGTLTSDAGGLLLRETDLAFGVIDNFTECFTDYRKQEAIEHPLRQLAAQRVFGICLGYEDLNDHEQLRYDPAIAALCGRVDVEGRDREREEDKGKALAGKSTLGRFESAGEDVGPKSRYKKISYDRMRVERFFVDHFLRRYNSGCQPGQIILDLDATDDPLHGKQEGRFFHGFYNCYCYLPLYIFCDDYLLAAKLRPSNIDAAQGADEELERIIGQIREVWPKVKIVVRGDSGFCREWLMSWCEEHGVDYLFGVARNKRLRVAIESEMEQARELHKESGKAARIYKDFQYRTLDSWSRSRRVIGKAEYLEGGENPRFVVTSLPKKRWPATLLYGELYCARGEMENRIKEQQLYLFADRTSSATMRANQLRLWFSSVAYVLMNELRQVALRGTELARAQCHTIRLKLLKIGARVTVSVRRVVIHMAGGYPYQRLFHTVLARIQAAGT